jgi:hypothetical protein
MVGCAAGEELEAEAASDAHTQKVYSLPIPFLVHDIVNAKNDERSCFRRCISSARLLAFD